MRAISGMWVFAATTILFLVTGCESSKSEASPTSGAHNVASTITTKNSFHEPSTTQDTSTLNSLQRQIQLLDQAVTPTSAEDAANEWAKAIQTRNGALQFAILVPQLQNQVKAAYESWNWRPGASSPWVEAFTVSKAKKISDMQYQFVITYKLTDSTHDTKISTDSIVVKKLHHHWYVSNTGGYRLAKLK